MTEEANYEWEELAEKIGRPDAARPLKIACLLAWREQHLGQPDPDEAALHRWLLKGPYTAAEYYVALVNRGEGKKRPSLEEICEASRQSVCGATSDATRH